MNNVFQIQRMGRLIIYVPDIGRYVSWGCFFCVITGEKIMLFFDRGDYNADLFLTKLNNIHIIYVSLQA